ncbi:MAG TPA: Gp138 family membrane-puncturing spike protein [Polyangiaceae bacterium]|nr:Gp138 family membrane-puncturing spike protein [Polyangiaceae bacterium]
MAPPLAEVIRLAIESRLAEVHTCLPGRVVTYNPATQRAEVQLVIRSAVEAEDGSTVHEDPPIIPNVPVAWMRGGGYSLQFPLAPGDHVWLMFSEAAMGHWRDTGAISNPGDLARHSLSYPIALPCIAPDAQALPPTVGDEALLQCPGKLRIGGPSAKAVARSDLVKAELEKIAMAFMSFVPGAGGASFTQPYTTAGDVAASKLETE